MITTPRIIAQTIHLPLTFLWQHPGAAFPPVGTASLVGVVPPVGGVHPVRLQRICHLFNARAGPKCTYSPRKFAHVCSDLGTQTQVEWVECPSTSGSDCQSRFGVFVKKEKKTCCDILSVPVMHTCVSCNIHMLSGMLMCNFWHNFDGPFYSSNSTHSSLPLMVHLCTQLP